MTYVYLFKKRKSYLRWQARAHINDRRRRAGHILNSSRATVRVRDRDAHARVIARSRVSVCVHAVCKYVRVPCPGARARAVRVRDCWCGADREITCRSWSSRYHSTVDRRRRFRSHRVRCGGRHGRRGWWRRRRNGNTGTGPADGGGRRGRRRRRPRRGARVYGHGVVGPAGAAQGSDHDGRRRRTPAGPGRGVSGRTVRRVSGAVHAARRVAHVVPEGGGRVVRPEPLPAAARRVPEAGVPAAAARLADGQQQQAAVSRPAELPETADAVPGQPERRLSVPQHIRPARYGTQCIMFCRVFRFQFLLPVVKLW